MLPRDAERVPKALNKWTQNRTNFENFSDHFWSSFGTHFRTKIGSRRGPKMGPLLEPPALHLRGPALTFSGIIRGVERLLELELYSPTKRDGLSQPRVRAFMTQLCWLIGGKLVPNSCSSLLEIMFDRTYACMRLGLHAGELHPFAEPHEQPLSSNTTASIENMLTSVLEDFREWCSRELFFFRSRVMFWDSDGMRSEALFSKSLAEHLARQGIKPTDDADDADGDEVSFANSSDSDDSGTSAPSSSGESSDARSVTEVGNDSRHAKGHGNHKHVSSTTSSPATSSTATSSSAVSSSAKSSSAMSRGIVVRKRNGGQGPITAESWTEWSEARQRATRSGDVVGHILGQACRPGKRKQIQANAVVFSSDVLLGRRVLSDIEVSQALLSMKDFFPLLWGFQRSDVPYHAPPPEIFSAPTLDQLRMQHGKLAELAEQVFSRTEFLKDFRRADKTKKKVPDALLLAAVLRVKYSIVKGRGVWHIVRLWLRILMVLLGSQASCEHMGSVLRFIEKKHQTGRPLDTRHLVRATRLRAAGLRGSFFEAPFLQACLEEHKKLMKWPREFPFLVQPRTHRMRALRGMIGPSMTIHRLRQKYYPHSSSNGAVLRYPWLVGEHTWDKSDLAKPLAVHLLSRSLAHVDVHACSLFLNQMKLVIALLPAVHPGHPILHPAL